MADRPDGLANPEEIFSGGGEMGERIRAFDWSQTPLGPVSSWSPSLRMMVRFLLANRFPLLLWWGPRFIQIYNDPYRPVLGAKHPKLGLGRPVSECWSEIWHVLRPLIETPFGGGPSTWMEDILLEINRHGFMEETHFTIAYSPVPDETVPSGIGGVLATVHEISEKVVGERRVGVLRDLGISAVEDKTAEEACSAAAETLARHPRDIPFALLYLIDPDGRRARLASAVGIVEGGPASPLIVDLGTDISDRQVWPLAETVRTETLQTVEDLPGRFGEAVPPGPWADPPRQAVVAPIRSNIAHQLAGLFVVGVSSRLRLDDSYHSFIELAAGQVATAVANARAYEEEKRRAEALAEIDRAKTDFFSNVSHEFRTPLTLMLGPLEDVISVTLDPTQKGELEAVHRNGLRLLKLVNTLLDFSRIEAGRVEAVYEPTDLATLTAELASVFRSAIERAGMRLNVDCPPLPEPVWVDRGMWEKIILNLLSNAFKFTLEGEIEVSLKDAGTGVELCVSDTGVGIPEEELSHVFDRFHRVRGTRGRTHEGSGIGLALVQELVRLHGGTVAVESGRGRGTTFTVRLPKGEAHLPPDRVRGARTLQSTALGAAPYVEEALRWLPGDGAAPEHASFDDLATAAPRVRRKTDGAHVLLADDNADMRDYVRRLLEGSYEVEAVADGRAALEAARERVPDLILSDVMMPQLDGFGLLRELRADERTRAVPVIMLSARAGEEAKIEGLEAGADDYLVKPFSSRELLARVQAHLELARVRREASEQLRESEERFRAFVTASSDVVYRMSADWSEMRQLVGREFIADTVEPSRTWLEQYIHPDDQPRVTEAIGEAIRNKSIFELEHRVIRVDGSLGWTFSRAIPLLDERGEIVEWFGAASDVTERRQAEAALREQTEETERLYREAQQASRLKDEFLATVSHELRTPLTAILGWARMLRGGQLDAGSATRALETVERNARAQNQLIEDLLDVSRIITGKLRLDVRPVDPAAFIESSVEAVRPAAEAKGVRLQKVLDTSVGAISGDADRLQQIVWNLLSNAIKFTPRGGRVQIRLERVNSHIEIIVTDTGAGIPAEFLPHVFDRFRQADGTTTRHHGGLGIGLAIVRHLVELHGGTVHAASHGEGQGATFIVRLPLLPVYQRGDDGERVHPGVSDALAPVTCPEQLNGLKVLVVDDEADACELLKELLTQCGAEVAVVNSAEAALTSIELSRPDVLVSDIGMPGTDGYELLRRIRRLPAERGGKVPAIALTAYARAEDRLRALRAGYQMHVPKPVEVAELIAVVASLAERIGET